MSVPKSSIDYTLRQYAANWKALTKGNGLEGWIEWLTEDGTDEFAFNTAFRQLCESRQEAKRFDPDKDRPRLQEMKAAYKAVIDQQISDGREELAQADCAYCQNEGVRYVVVHNDGSTMAGEEIITQIPAIPRQYCYLFKINCSCARGELLKDSRIKSTKPRKVMSHERQREVLFKSFTYSDAYALVKAYHLTHKPTEPEIPKEIKCRKCKSEFMPNELGGNCPVCAHEYSEYEASKSRISRWMAYLKRRIGEMQKEAVV